MRLVARIPYLRKYFSRNKIIETNLPHEFQVSEWLEITEDLDDMLDMLRSEGYCSGIKLKKEALSKLISFCDESIFFSDGSPNTIASIKFSDKTTSSKNSIYRLINPHERSAIVYDLIYKSPLDFIASRYLEANPVLVSSQIWYTFPKKSKKNHHNFGFHYDIDDYKFLKFFFYLDEVSEVSGPHVIISQTHKEGSVFKFINRRISDEIAKSRYPNQIVVMTGEPGSGFSEDTFCYHKGTYPLKRRLILQITFGIS